MSVLTTETKTLRLDLPPEGFRLERGGVLSEINIAYETCGTLSAAKDNVIFICHALTGDAHVAGYHNPADEKSAGWWANMIKPGGGIDTDKFHVVCANILGGCKGTTGPSSTNPATGKPYGKDFPRITVRDIVSVHKLFLEQIGFAKISAVIGGSFGGMQALEMSLAFPGFADKCVCIASGGTVTTQALAFDVVGRAAITSDPNFKGGDYYDGGARPDAGLAHARRLAHITYLSEEMLKVKFGREKRPEAEQFQIESYLRYQGEKFIARFDANSYIRITEAMDEYDVAIGFASVAESAARSSSKTAFIALSSDWLFLPEQSRALASAYLAAKKDVTYFRLEAPAGHDSFLTHIDELRDVVAAFLTLETSVSREAKSAEKSDDYDRLLDMTPKGAASVLDLACNEGVLLNRALARNPALRRVGLDVSGKALVPVLRSGSNAILADIDGDLDMIPDNSFDCVFLSGSLQVLRDPAKAVARLLRIAPVALVSFPNFGNWKIRMSLLFRGRMPKTKRLPHSWHNTPNIHLCTLRDFKALCAETGCRIERLECLATHPTSKLLNAIGLKNLGSSRVIARISRIDKPSVFPNMKFSA
ncbi:MAG: homoserine O-acetyltransferase [Kiritimatiellaeota bacterium]|nr:homoserine O-acetyltransferase [Kiritimatiellota bacterium]